MNLERKLELLNELAGTGRRFPANSVYRDGEYALATNGWQLLAFRAADGEFDGLLTLDEGAKRFEEFAKREVKAPEDIRLWLSREAEMKTVNSRDLYSFLRADEYLHCPYCKGCGVRPLAEPDLEEGLDDPFENVRVVDFDGALINSGLLLSVLAYLPVSRTVALSTWPAIGACSSGGQEGRILRLVGDGWVVIQMSVIRVEGYEIEAFPLESAAIAEAA